MRSLKPLHVLSATALAGVLLIAAAAWTGDYWRDILIDLGTGLIGAVATFILLNTFLPKVLNADGRRHDGFSYSAFAVQVKKSRSQVRILTTFLYPFTNHPQYARMFDELVDAIDQLIKQRKDRVEVQILILDPASDAAKQRAEERTDDDVIRRIQENLAEFHRLREERHYQESFRKVEVKLFDRLPPLALFQTDNRGSMSFYPRYMKISEAPRFEFSMDSPLGTFMSKTFDDVWTDPRTKDLDEYIWLTLRIVHSGAENGIDCRVHYVEDGSNAYYVLLRKDRDADTLALLTSTVAGVRLEVVREKKLHRCTCSHVAISDRVHKLGMEKYGAFPYYTMVELCVESADATGPAASAPR